MWMLNGGTSNCSRDILTTAQQINFPERRNQTNNTICKKLSEQLLFGGGYHKLFYDKENKFYVVYKLCSDTIQFYLGCVDITIEAK